ncbi:MAG TPA: hypothetical protein ENJ82_17765 [Bacteroidetes bacterium]|nr:hypothetical protein [Bacteroidota bacterium]
MRAQGDAQGAGTDSAFSGRCAHKGLLIELGQIPKLAFRSSFSGRCAQGMLMELGQIPHLAEGALTRAALGAGTDSETSVSVRI